MLIAGGAFFAGAIPFAITANSTLKRGIRLYNQSLKTVYPAAQKSMGLWVTNDGLALRLNF